MPTPTVSPVQRRDRRRRSAGRGVRSWVRNVVETVTCLPSLRSATALHDVGRAGLEPRRGAPGCPGRSCAGERRRPRTSDLDRLQAAAAADASTTGTGCAIGTPVDVGRRTARGVAARARPAPTCGVVGGRAADVSRCRRQAPRRRQDAGSSQRPGPAQAPNPGVRRRGHDSRTCRNSPVTTDVTVPSRVTAGPANDGPRARRSGHAGSERGEVGALSERALRGSTRRSSPAAPARRGRRR